MQRTTDEGLHLYSYHYPYTQHVDTLKWLSSVTIFFLKTIQIVVILSWRVSESQRRGLIRFNLEPIAFTQTLTACMKNSRGFHSSEDTTYNSFRRLHALLAKKKNDSTHISVKIACSLCSYRITTSTSFLHLGR